MRRAEKLGTRLGISRVTDTTRLDHLGIPVFASIRPGADRRSLCVNAGKGLTAADARVGAWMEAIEYAMAEPGASSLAVVAATPRDVLDGHARPDAVLDFCPRLGSHIPLEEPMACVHAEELISGTRCLVPAELIFLPTTKTLVPRPYFGASSIGLASGNTALEATVHGLAEALEHDILAFQFVRDTSVRVRNETFPPAAMIVDRTLRERGVSLYVRFQPNAFGIPFFSATLSDPDLPSPYFVNGGYGCHPHREIALLRAICEAAQSRLSFIHGGRDDLIDFYRRFEAQDQAARLDYVHRLVAKVSAADAVSFSDITDRAEDAQDLDSTLTVLTQALADAGLHRVCRVVYTDPDEELQVVRILVPGLEHFDETSSRVGRRLRDHVEQA